MPKRPKIDLDKVKASLLTRCKKCGYAIPPAEVRLVNTSDGLNPGGQKASAIR